MATLTETAYYSRKTITYGAIGIVAFLILRGLIIFGVATYRRLNPPPLPPPTVSFGRLPVLSFPQEQKQPALSYRLETVGGTTPDLGDRATVFFMPVRQANLLALDRMNKQAAKLDFDREPEQLSPRRYRWTSDAPLPASLTADIVSGSFFLEVAWQQDPGILAQTNLPDQDQAVQEARRFLQSAGLSADDLSGGNADVSFFKADINDMVPAVSLSEANFVRVDFFRSDVEDLVVYPPNPQRGIVSLTFSGSRSKGKREVELRYNYFPVSYDQSATYPIKTSLTAWNELQAGEGFVAQVDPDVSQVVVRRVTLGYYDSALPQHYMQPIYVFQGDDNFVGYVAAISPEWIE